MSGNRRKVGIIRRHGELNVRARFVQEMAHDCPGHDISRSWTALLDSSLNDADAPIPLHLLKRNILLVKPQETIGKIGKLN